MKLQPQSSALSPITTFLRRTGLASMLALIFATSFAANDSGKSTEREVTEASYPHTFDAGTYEVTKFQPQIDEWKDFKYLKGRMAVSINKKGSEEVKYASLEFEADTVADKEHGVVHIGPRKILKYTFVDAKDAAEETMLKKVLATVDDGNIPLKVNLDAMVANVEQSAVMHRDVEVNLTPPPIFYSDSPAVMVTFMGEPDFKAVDSKTNALLFALNTNWDVLMDVASSTYYLLIEDGWVMTKDLQKGPWSIAKSLPATFQKLPDDENWKDVRAALNAKPFETLPKIFVTYQPAELIESDGKPKLSPVSGTKLMYLTNTESDVFFRPEDRHYYYLVEGRWFKSTDLEKGWEAATLDLPKDFANIPEDHKKSHVLASVEGTKVAEEAAVLASIPETATVSRADTKLTVEYNGEPEFKAIPKSKNVQFAVNTDKDVFLVNGNYFCCYQGVWFVASKPTGPWIVCDKVDKDIYTIPSESPKYNVTYVNVYNSTPTTVQVGYTSGYTGQYIFRGMVFFGMGYWLGHHHHYYYPPYYVGWGCGGRWGWHGGYYRPGHWGYGPYGGWVRPRPYYRGRYYRPARLYGRPHIGYPRPVYNPSIRINNGNVIVRPTPYKKWTNKGVKPDHLIARDRYKFSRDKALKPSTKPIAKPNLRPSTRPALKPADKTRPNVFVGKDGNIYKKDKGGNWHQRDKSGWKKPAVDIKPTPKPNIKPTPKPNIKPTPKPNIKPTPKPNIKPTPKPNIKPTPKPNIKPTPRPNIKPTPRPNTRPTPRPTPRPSTRPASSHHSYNNNRSTGSKLHWDSTSRSRNFSRPSSRSSMRPAPSRTRSGKSLRR